MIINRDLPNWAGVLNPIGLEVQADPNWNTYASYGIRVTVTGGNGQSLSFFQRPGLGDKTTFDLRRAVLAILGDDQEQPDLNSYVKVMMPGAISVVIEEVADGAVMETENKQIKVIRGGFHPRLGQMMSTWTADGKFLTNQPRKKRSSRKVWELLQVVLNDQIIPVNGMFPIHISMKFSDGNEITGTIEMPVQGAFPNAGDLIQIPVGWEHLNLSQYGTNGQDPIEWTVWLQQGRAILSERMTYTLRGTTFSSIERQYLFRNQLGGWDTLRTTGLNQTKIAVERSEMRIPGSPFDNFGRKVFSTLGRSYHRGAQDTGTLTQAERIWFREFIRSENVWAAKDEEQKDNSLTPIYITTQNVAIFEDENFVGEEKFEYKEACV